ncbi:MULTISPECIES: TetR/AcrR family transcriptional regulator [Thermomonospora]|uniref:Transcriptional regulator, TetR family n=1 Tax=Thermomonospora curvata (strain ATCC 19995 / DSM 43183 / JCM 3096 / KCTC 9072 / NBRC 15933 / NCIMB 10081 / Henssen B9) TaxID=471852 RepID=D1A8H6_THECD|nr:MULTISPECIES: TetR/AcrR family transcriptional regulator [Thermomonospora]ACY96671.1 transcriptional regulator, TetR family [Thermomonospora curvata DSM 43183]PKK15467.1 MAG: TetR/AcrR family transcriptional regulator [Thermomonospora sp. CIF 1]
MSSDIQVPPGEAGAGGTASASATSGGGADNAGRVPAQGGETPARGSDRGAATRSALLAAARDVFAECGFAQAAVTDIVARAGASVGSLYHHFNGKADLYLTLWEEFQARQQERTRQAVHAARAAGESDPMRLFIAGANAYLDGCLADRRLSRLFVRGDGPPGFERVMQKRLRKWARRNAALFHAPDGTVDEPLVTVLTGAMAAAVTEIAGEEDEQAARKTASEIMAIIETIRNPRTERS